MWIYSQSSGQLWNPDGDRVATGYAGAGAGKNNPAMQHVMMMGPLPRGIYTTQPPRDSLVTGPFVIDLEPDAENKMFRRGNFQIHGDSIKSPGNASKGCIIMPRWVRETVSESVCKTLRVIE